MPLSDKLPACSCCAYGRRADGLCDIHGTTVTKNLVCRAYRDAGQSHLDARGEYPLLERLLPGRIYSIKAGKTTTGQSVSAKFKIEPIPRTEPTPSVGDTVSHSFVVKVRNIDGSESRGRFDCYESGLVILAMADIRYGSQGSDDAFHALQQIREAMEIDGRIPLVNGSNRNAIVSGMTRSMGGGYVVNLVSSDSRNNTTADTFGTDLVTDPVFVAEQENFKDAWFAQPDPGSPRTLEADSSNAALGAVLGALAGDAAGATLEFIGRRPTATEVGRAMAMVGGGVWKTAPGQITDDGELTLALAYALNGTASYNPNRAAHWYRKWYLSKPFDIGNATANALGSGELESLTLAETVMANARKSNYASKANGSLMRLSALGVWSTKLSLDDAVIAARTDAQLTHPHPSCQWAGAAYVAAIRHLIFHPGDAQGAFSLAESVVSESGVEEITAWLSDARNGNLPSFHPSAGFVRIAFTHAFHGLIRQHSYEEAISAVLAGGGDTDTNACIVGGLLGALNGANTIPKVMRSRVLECDTECGRPRPAWLQTTQVEALVSSLLLSE